MAATIGIKIANGEFYSIIDENVRSKKRLVLTTVHDNQRSVQIDLYKSAAQTMADALYIGSLVVENIKSKSKGDPSIEMIISSNEKGEISAEAIDLDTSAGGQHQYLNVSLRSLDEDNREYDLPDFELESHEGPPSGLYEQANALKQKKEEKKSLPWIGILAIGLALIVLCLGLWFIFIHNKGTFDISTAFRPPAQQPSVQQAPVAPAPAVPAPAPQPAAPAPQAPPAPAPQPAAPAQSPQAPAPQASVAASPPATQAPSATQPASPAPAQPAARPAPVIQAPAQPKPATTAKRVRPPAPVSSYKVPATIPRNGVAYKLRWGDTLWDIAEAFYRNPWLYPRIARYNGIKNPDLIVSGRTIRIPPKN